jgi:very-short-patch-repair endonuclease
MSNNVYERLLATINVELEIALTDSVDEILAMVDSPIEGMFLGALCIGVRLSHIRPSSVSPVIAFRRFTDDAAADFNSAPIRVVTQYEWKTYRIDFAMFVGGSADPIAFVECDGHEFHERTADQAERDRSRDRVIQDHGIPILRFTGREIYRDPYRCAGELLAIAGNRVGPAHGRKK